MMLLPDALVEITCHIHCADLPSVEASRKAIQARSLDSEQMGQTDLLPSTSHWKIRPISIGYIGIDIENIGERESTMAIPNCFDIAIEHYFINILYIPNDDRKRQFLVNSTKLGQQREQSKSMDGVWM